MLLRIVWYFVFAILFAGPAFFLFILLVSWIKKVIKYWRAILYGEPSGDLLTDYGIRAIQEQLERTRDDR